MSSIDYRIEDVGLLLMLVLLCFKSLAMLIVLIHHCPAMFYLHLLDAGLQLFNGLISDCDFIFQILVLAFQRFHLTTAEKRTYSACKGCGSIGSYAFEFVGAYLRFHQFEFLLGKIYLVFLVLSLCLYSFKLCTLLLDDKVVTLQMLLARLGFGLSSLH